MGRVATPRNDDICVTLGISQSTNKSGGREWLRAHAKLNANPVRQLRKRREKSRIKLPKPRALRRKQRNGRRVRELRHCRSMRTVRARRGEQVVKLQAA